MATAPGQQWRRQRSRRRASNQGRSAIVRAAQHADRHEPERRLRNHRLVRRRRCGSARLGYGSLQGDAAPTVNQAGAEPIAVRQILHPRTGRKARLDHACPECRVMHSPSFADDLNPCLCGCHSGSHICQHRAVFHAATENKPAGSSQGGHQQTLTSTEVAMLFGTPTAETVLASVHVRAHQQAEYMGASDLIKALQTALRGGARSLIAPPLSMAIAAHLLPLLPCQGHGSLRGRRLPPQHPVRSTGAAMSTTGSRGSHAAQRPPSQPACTLALVGNSHPRRRLRGWNSSRLG